ncbi:reverse transcriptase domain-containing protein [Tanacetum coccineum]
MVTQAFNIKNSMSMLVQKSQDHKKAKDHKMMIRDYAWLMISKKLKIHIQVKPIRTSSSLKSMITTTYHKLKIEVNDYELKTKVKAFGSNFKKKVTDNDRNIIGMKSHDCYKMMQQLLPYGLQQYLDTDIAKLIIKLCLFFKQICARTLMEDDMVRAESQLIDILCNPEQIYPPAFFDIMIHLVIHLPEEALKNGPIPYR